MKKFIGLILFALSSLLSFGQCSTVTAQVSSSDTTVIQLYHAGFFNIPSGNANVCGWKVSSFSGEFIYQDTTLGDAFEQGQILFNHSVSIMDSMNLTIVITNSIEGITCTINDTLYWKETEVIPGIFIGNWDVLSSNGGVEEVISSFNEVSIDEKELIIYPSPSDDYFQIEGNQESYSFSIFDSKGRVTRTFENIHNNQKVNISNLPKGIYFIRFRNIYDLIFGVKKMIKN